ncbi:hypothetical protein D3C81_1536930 [compost metagenome]
MPGDQQQRTTGVGRVVGDGDGSAILQLTDRLDLLRVGTKGFDVHSDDWHLIAAWTILFVRLVIRFALEVIGVQQAFIRLPVWLDIVREYFDIQRHPFLGQFRLEKFQDLGMGHGYHSDFQGFGIGRPHGCDQQCNGESDAFHDSFPSKRFREKDERSKSVEPRMHHCANASPSAAECLKPWPEQADTTKVCCNDGCSSMMK